MSKIGNYILERVGKEYFTEKDENEKDTVIPAMGQNNGKRIVIGVIRETIGPFIDRSSIPDETITLTIENNGQSKEVIEVPARKFKSKEKLLGIKFCKLYDVIDRNYRYNSLSDINMLNNPVSVIMGDTVVLGDTAGQGMLPSRLLYSSSYSIRDRSLITERRTHNSLSYNGTMWDQVEGKNRQSLFETEYVVPGVYFPSFLTLIDPTPESLFFVLEMLKENSYGAQTSITGTNIKNNTIFILGCHNEPPISSYEISKDYNDSEVNLAKLQSFILDEIKKLSGNEDHIIYGNELSDITNFLENVTFEERKKAFEKLRDDSSDLWKYANFGKKKNNKKQTMNSKNADILEEDGE